MTGTFAFYFMSAISHFFVHIVNRLPPHQLQEIEASPPTHCQDGSAHIYCWLMVHAASSSQLLVLPAFLAMTDS